MTEEFEKWLLSKGIDTAKVQDAWNRIIYKHSHVQAAWEGWRAAKSGERQSEEIPEIPGFFKPKYGETYWYVDFHYQNVSCFEWKSSGMDFLRSKNGNVFRTEAQARKRLEQIEVMAQLRRLAGGYKFKEGTYNWHLEREKDKWCVVANTLVQIPGVTYFSSQYSAQAAIAEIGEERLNLLLEMA